MPHKELWRRVARHALWIGAILAHIDFLDEQIERLSTRSRSRSAPFAPAVELPCTITGIQHRGAQCILTEIGTDMSAFPSPRHLAYWAGQCPGNDQSAGKRRSGKTRDASRLDYALEEAAMAANRVKGELLAAQYQRLKPRRGHKKSLGAVKHTRSSARSGTSSRPARSTATSAGVGSPTSIVAAAAKLGQHWNIA